MNDAKITYKAHLWRTPSGDEVEMRRLSDEYVSVYDPQGNTDAVYSWLANAVKLAFASVPIDQLSLFAIDYETFEFDFPNQLILEGSREQNKLGIKDRFLGRRQDVRYKLVDLVDQKPDALDKFIHNVADTSFAPGIGIIQSRPEDCRVAGRLIERALSHQPLGNGALADPFREGHKSILVFNHDVDGFYLCAAGTVIDEFCSSTLPGGQN